ncbi:hypothetical protein [Piscinibacter sp.]|uniref:hypothetical protein n=1 Tax=Piscinibacter sp. TaxID=1903157 RepID=UPI002C5B3258|nr:hypothetical protein [Albitalea sp.]HUG24705.1 hypothetical protein [Albitalea sp.]
MTFPDPEQLDRERRARVHREAVHERMFLERELAAHQKAEVARNTAFKLGMKRGASRGRLVGGCLGFVAGLVCGTFVAQVWPRLDIARRLLAALY